MRVYQGGGQNLFPSLKSRIYEYSQLNPRNVLVGRRVGKFVDGADDCKMVGTVVNCGENPVDLGVVPGAKENPHKCGKSKMGGRANDRHRPPDVGSQKQLLAFKPQSA